MSDSGAGWALRSSGRRSRPKGNATGSPWRARLNHGPQRSRIALSAVATTSWEALSTASGLSTSSTVQFQPRAAAVSATMPRIRPLLETGRSNSQRTGPAPVSSSVSPMRASEGRVSATLRYVPWTPATSRNVRSRHSRMTPSAQGRFDRGHHVEPVDVDLAAGQAPEHRSIRSSRRSGRRHRRRPGERPSAAVRSATTGRRRA